MSGRVLHSGLDREFVTIYFMQETGGKNKIAVRRISLIMGVILVLFGVVFLRVWQEMQVVKLGYKITQLRGEYDTLLDQQRILLSRRNSLANLERIEKVARNKLGLDTPRKDQLVFLVDPAIRSEGWRGCFNRWIKQAESFKFAIRGPEKKTE